MPQHRILHLFYVCSGFALFKHSWCKDKSRKKYYPVYSSNKSRGRLVGGLFFPAVSDSFEFYWMALEQYGSFDIV